MTKNVDLSNTFINITEKKVIGTVIGARQVKNIHVFNMSASLAKWHPRREDDRVENSCAHAWMS